MSFKYTVYFDKYSKYIFFSALFLSNSTKKVVQIRQSCVIYFKMQKSDIFDDTINPMYSSESTFQ